MRARSLAKLLLPPLVSDMLSRLLLSPSPVVLSASSHRTYQDEFIEFIAQRRNMEWQEAERCVVNAQNQFVGGWGGDEYRHFTELALETCRPLYDETSGLELIETYTFHGPFDFLRMLGYTVPEQADVEPILHYLSSKKTVGIIDYGCGLAHRTIAASRYLLERGVEIHLTFIDIYRVQHVEFLDFLCRKYGIQYEFIEVTGQRLYPTVTGEYDYCDIVSVLEHVKEPITVITNIHQALRPGGLLLALVKDQTREMMHVSPDLKEVRERLTALGYRQVAACAGVPLFQKPLTS